MKSRIRLRAGPATAVPSVKDNNTTAFPPSGNDPNNDSIHVDDKQRRNASGINPRIISLVIAITLLAMTTFLLIAHAPLPSSSSSRNLVPLFDTNAITLSKNIGRRRPSSSDYPSEVYSDDKVGARKGNKEKDYDDEQNNGDSDEKDAEAAIECRYDGHCPVGRTCAVAVATTALNNNPERLPGTCLKIPIVSQEQQQQPTQACLEACRRELEMDEHFQHEKWPDIIGHDATTYTRGRPRGCVLYYKRTPDRTEQWQELHDQDQPWLKQLLDPSNHGHGMQTHDLLPTIRAWEARRFRHIVRVDPAKPQDDGDDTWMAYCTEPCQTDADCQPATSSSRSSVATVEKPFVCQQGACQRNSAFWEAMTVRQKQQHEEQGGEMVFVTAASSHYFRGLRNLLGSIRYWAPHCKVVVYNLGGLKDAQMDWIRQQPSLLTLEWQNGIPDTYPPHVHVGKMYAWKPIIIQETLAKYKMIFWIDAGSTLRGPITPIEDIVKRNGIVLFHGQDESMTPRAHFKSYEWFNFTKATMVTGPHVSGNTQVYLSPSRYVDSLVNCNAACAMDPKCIAPIGSGLHNHRFDQTTLSLCAYHPKVWPNHHTEYLACVAERLPRDARAASYKIVFTARQATRAYKDMKGNYLLDAAQNKSARRQFTYSAIA